MDLTLPAGFDPHVEIGHCETHGNWQKSFRGPQGEVRSEPCCPGCLKASRERGFIEEGEIPKLFANVSFQNYRTDLDPGQVEALQCVYQYTQDFETALQCGRCLILLGSYGTGKTHLAISAIKDLLARGYVARYLTVDKLIRRVRSTWATSSKVSEDEVLKYLCETIELLVVDEIGGRQLCTDSEQVELLKILDGRYSAGRPTIDISNSDMAGLQQILGGAVIDRLRQSGGRAEVLTWNSVRREI